MHNPIQAFHSYREQLEALCRAQSQKFILSRDIGSQGPWREQRHSRQSQNVSPVPHCFALDVNENAVKRTQARRLHLFSN